VVKAESLPPQAQTAAATEMSAAQMPATAADTTTAQGACLIRHVVQPGESLWRISRDLLGDPLLYLRVAKLNQLADPDLLEPGQILVLDPAWMKTPPSATTRQMVQCSPRSPVAVSRTAEPAPNPNVEFPARPNLAFKPGELLTFSVEYFGIAAGIATLGVEQGPLMHGRPTLRIVATARTHPAFEWIFKVRDRIESYLDAQGLFPWQYEKHLREGGYANDAVMVYDQPKCQVIKDQGKTIVPAPACTQDVLSEFYFYRTLAAKPGDVASIPVVADDGKTYEVVVTAKREERITGPTGTYDCLVVVPAMKFEGLFQAKGQIEIWLTNDARRVPVLIKTKIVIGTIDIVLREAVVVE
jgi:hypothetical protein